MHTSKIQCKQINTNVTLSLCLCTAGCTCEDPTGTCIMAAISTSGSEPDTWSSCSEDFLNVGFNTHNLNSCLGNQPTTMVGDPVCGNGLREGDEVCDCGSASECNDPCCNAATCELATGAACSAGECCTSQCAFVTAGTSCRAAVGSCDVAEYCSGSSGDCPDNEVVLDGESCTRNGDSAFCYSGECPNNDILCEEAWSKSMFSDILSFITQSCNV